MNKAAAAQVIETLKAAEAAIQSKLANVSGFVIVWHDSCLKVTDGSVSLCGENIYSGKASEMIQAAAKWNTIIGADEPRAVAMPAKLAAAKLAKAHAEMIAAIEASQK
jgi:hypothetical protein